MKLRSHAFPRPAFGGLLLAVLLLMTVSEMALGIATYSRLRRELEADLAQRLVNVAKLLAVGTDVSLVTQFREGDEQIPAYQLVASRFVVLARAAGVERVYVVGDRLELDVALTTDLRALESRIARVDSIGGTAMRDAIEVAEAYLSGQATRDRRVLLLITDGNDNASMTPMDRIRKQAART